MLVDNATELIVDPTFGMLHHYRESAMESFVKQPEKYTFVQDNFMLKYHDKLMEAVTQRIKIIESYSKIS